jgi:hypothetical protein
MTPDLVKESSVGSVDGHPHEQRARSGHRAGIGVECERHDF